MTYIGVTSDASTQGSSGSMMDAQGTRGTSGPDGTSSREEEGDRRVYDACGYERSS